MVTKQSDEELELYRREAMGAFAHEVRTPLTSIKMVMELARRQSKDGEFVLDAELAEMLRASVEDLQELADDLQEASRLERGRLVLATGPCDLGAAVDAAREMLTQGPELAGTSPHGVEGPWDARRLVRAIAGFAQAANRIGDGSGSVRFDWEESAGMVTLTFASGKRGGEPRAIAADAGFSFFRSRQLVVAMGGSVHCNRAERYVEFNIDLPLSKGGGARG
jgi:signal transduction histidine kinase